VVIDGSAAFVGVETLAMVAVFDSALRGHLDWPGLSLGGIAVGRRYGLLVGLAWAVAVFMLCTAGSAQRLLVTTTTLSATREAARVYVQSVDMGLGAPLPGPAVLPGVAPLGALLTLPGARIAIQCSGPTWKGGDFDVRHTWTHLSVLRLNPFEAQADHSPVPGWRQVGACVTLPPLSRQPVFVALGLRLDEAGVWQGRAEAYRSTPEAGARALAKDVEWEFAGAPVAGVALSDTGRIAVLCQGPPGTGAALRVFDVCTGDVAAERYEIADAEDQLGVMPTAIAATRDGASLLVLTSGYALGRQSGAPSSWLHVVDARDFASQCEPVELAGAGRADEAVLHPVGPASCWIATRSPSAGFAYATLVRVTEDGVAKDAHVPLTGVCGSFHLAPHPAGGFLAVAMDNRLEVWPEDQRIPLAETYEAPIGVVRWTQEGLFVGEGGRVHLVDSLSLRPIKTIQLQTGHVTDIVLVPLEYLPAPDPDADGLGALEESRLGTSPTCADTDGDGIADGSDPEPLIPSPRLRVPAAITLHGEAAGNELQAFVLDPLYAENASWRIAYARERIPWLVIHPVSGEAGNLPAVVYMGIDPARYVQHGEMGERLTVHMTGAESARAAAGSPATIQVRVIPAERNEIRRILWIWPEDLPRESLRSSSDPHGLRALAEVLAAPPHFFAHREAASPFTEGLDPYAVVVLGAEAAARGALTRQALLNYVAEGGALLFLGKYLAGQDTRALIEWLSPMRIQVDTSAKIQGVFRSVGPHWLCRHWNDVRIVNGCAIRAEDASGILVPVSPDSPEAILLARTYGRGRVALLASPTPLASSSMQVLENRLLAGDLFRWLARAGVDPEDADGDGLTDDTEDRNTNGATDPGETNYLDPDTDGDGIPDGLEDINLNGVVDEGETSPLNPDSDGDGIFDGADAVPIPPIGAPHVAGAFPSQGPAEGGGFVLISGRNLPPDALVWFGNRQSPAAKFLRSSYVVAEVPPCDEQSGGNVPVRIGNSAGDLDGVLPTGFHYTPLSQVRLVLDTLEVVHKSDQVYEGFTSVHLDTPPKTDVHQLILLVKAEPPEGFQWLDLIKHEGSTAAAWQVITKAARSGDFLVIVLRGKQSRPIAGEIGTLHWQASACLGKHEAAASSLQIVVKGRRVVVRNGQALDVSIEGDAAVNLRSARPPG